jgi:hypothetical protein
MQTDRWYTACHEAGHAVASLSRGIHPDAVRLYCDLSGKVHRIAYREVHEFMLREDEKYRWNLALFAIAGPVAELMAKGEYAMEGDIEGSLDGDLGKVNSLFPDYDDQEMLKQDAVFILEDNRKLWLRLALLVEHLGYLHGDDLSSIWYQHKRYQHKLGLHQNQTCPTTPHLS